MSSDMMIIYKQDDSNYEGDTNKAFFIDECSMGDPWHEFGSWFSERFCGHPTITEQMAGVKEHNYTKVTEADLEGIRYALKTMRCHKNLNPQKLLDFIKEHIGMHISTENW